MAADDRMSREAMPSISALEDRVGTMEASQTQMAAVLVQIQQQQQRLLDSGGAVKG